MKLLFLVLLAGTACAQVPVAQQIAERIQALKPRYAQLADFDAKTAVKGGAIRYCRKSRTVPNPEWERLTAEQREEDRSRPGRMRMMIPETITVFDPPDGVCLSIWLATRQEVTMGQRAWQPRHWIQGLAVDLQLDGAPGDGLVKLAQELDRIFASMADPPAQPGR